LWGGGGWVCVGGVGGFWGGVRGGLHLGKWRVLGAKKKKKLVPKKLEARRKGVKLPRKSQESRPTKVLNDQPKGSSF